MSKHNKTNRKLSRRKYKRHRNLNEKRCKK